MTKCHTHMHVLKCKHSTGALIGSTDLDQDVFKDESRSSCTCRAMDTALLYS